MRSAPRFLGLLSMRLRWSLLVAALAAGILGWRNLTPAAAPGAEAAPPAPAAFRPSKEQWAALHVAPVKTLQFRSTLVTDGAIAFNDDAMTLVFSPYSGRVTRLIARLGDRVKKGAPLMAVEASELVQGRSDVASAGAALEAARAAEQRTRELYEAGAGAFKDWRQAQSDLVGAQAQLAAARGRLRVLGKSEAEIDALAGAPVGPAEAIVVAPIAGTVTQRQVGLGQYITSAAGGAAGPVYTIGDLSTVWLVANVREADAPRLSVGQAADVSVLAAPDRVFRGRVSWIGAAVDPVTHRLPVRVEVKNADGFLKPQMFARFSIATSEPREAPAVPAQAIVFEGEAARVFVAGADGSLSARPIRTGHSRDGMVEVVEGLKAGEKIVTAGTLFIDRASEGAE